MAKVIIIGDEQSTSEEEILDGDLHYPEQQGNQIAITRSFK